jgi:hypothetical protein
VRWDTFPASVDKGLVHVEHQSDFLLVGLLDEGLGDNEGVFLLGQGIEIVFDLAKERAYGGEEEELNQEVVFPLGEFLFREDLAAHADNGFLDEHWII